MATEEIDGVKYETGAYGFGDSCDISSESMLTEYTDGKPCMRVDFGKRAFLVVSKGLKSWTFRGFDASGALKTEGDILPITDDNVRKLPPRHGDVLYKVIQDENEMTEDEIKNSPGQ